MLESQCLRAATGGNEIAERTNLADIQGPGAILLERSLI